MGRYMVQLITPKVPAMAVSTMKQLSQTRYMKPVSDWRYDALYHGSLERFRLMRETAEWMGEMVNGIVRNGYPIEPT